MLQHLVSGTVLNGTATLAKALQGPNDLENILADNSEAISFVGILRALIVLYAVFVIMALIDLQRVVTIFVASPEEADETDANKTGPLEGASPTGSPSSSMGLAGAQSPQSASWSVCGVCCLMAYRLYTGFNTATWLPYLLAREGEDLWYEDQAAFMGLAKLIYGGTMLLNPLMGLFGDFVVIRSHGLGRRVFLRMGVLTAATGIFICLRSDLRHNFYWFMTGILIWRFGECMNDVTVEALAPEMVPSSQYPMASAVKGALFLLGGVIGYVMLMFATDLHYSWLYSAYLIGMLICSLPALLLLREDGSSVRQSCQMRRLQSKQAFDYLTHAYLAPARLPGGFPWACLSVFVFALGTSPMYFLLLMVRDVVGVRQQAIQQRQFSYISVIFFLFAVVAAVFSGGSMAAPGRDGQVHHNKDDPDIFVRSRRLIIAVIVFGLLAISMPFMAFFDTAEMRMAYFYCFATLFGFCFGAAYTRFQDITWLLVPEGVEWANTMGFNVMCRNAGVGMGNFLAGILLNLFAEGIVTEVIGGEHVRVERQASYALSGYFVMCGASGIAVLLAALLAMQAVNAHPLQSGETRPLAADFVKP